MVSTRFVADCLRIPVDPIYHVTSVMLTRSVTLKNGNNQGTDIERTTEAKEINGLDNERVIKTFQNARTNPLRYKPNSQTKAFNQINCCDRTIRNYLSQINIRRTQMYNITQFQF